MVEMTLTMLSVYLIQAWLCAIIHIINKSEIYPKDFKTLVFHHLNIFWVILHLKRLRRGGY